MKSISLSIALALALLGCGKKEADKQETPVTTASGSAPAPAADAAPVAEGSGTGSAVADPGSGSAVADSGSGSAAGSADAGSADAGSADAGSGSAVADAGSGAYPADDDPANYPHHNSAFDKLTREERAKFMKEKVVPAMKKEFQAFDPKEFGTFNCATCHGKKGKENKWHMPNPDLPKLDFAALQAGKQEPKMAEFMGKVVNPKMAELLGAEPYDPKTQKGFGCMDCHLAKE